MTSRNSILIVTISLLGIFLTSVFAIVIFISQTRKDNIGATGKNLPFKIVNPDKTNKDLEERYLEYLKYIPSQQDIWANRMNQDCPIPGETGGDVGSFTTMRTEGCVYFSPRNSVNLEPGSYINNKYERKFNKDALGLIYFIENPGPRDKVEIKLYKDLKVTDYNENYNYLKLQNNGYTHEVFIIAGGFKVIDSSNRIIFEK